MKLFAQHGYAPGDKMQRGVQQGYIDGAILSPRHAKPTDARELAGRLRQAGPECEIMLDPEFLATKYVDTPNSHLRYLDEWRHFAPVQRNALLVGTEAVDRVVHECLAVQRDTGCTSFIAPNVYISSSFDSLDGAIALSFFGRSQAVARDMGIDAHVHATIAMSTSALANPRERASFLNALTSIEPSPGGVYVLVGVGSADEHGGVAKSELLTPEVIAGWMLMNYSCALNGMRVLNGYSDVLTPLLGIAGGYAGATGWWSNLQVFSPARYLKLGTGGRQPLCRYFSNLLLNRVTIHERQAYAEFVPEIMNGAATDAPYMDETTEPHRVDEALQHWDAIASLAQQAVADDVNTGLSNMLARVSEAQEAYARLESAGFTENYETNMDYLAALRDGMNLFRKLAEI
ncbi:MAG: hypothetical protein NTY63_00155 [Candidatus Bipolaricaulota bacterium]|nr:hypothetical protein [Candidatus Bipolaricaulota bacterium]